MAWIRPASAAVTNGSATVTIAGTVYAALIQPGYELRAPVGTGQSYEVTAVATSGSNTVVTLARAFAGSTAADSTVEILPLFASGDDAATKIAQTLAAYIQTLGSLYRAAGNNRELVLARSVATALGGVELGTGATPQWRIGVYGDDRLRMQRYSGGVWSDVMSWDAAGTLTLAANLQLGVSPALDAAVAAAEAAKTSAQAAQAAAEAAKSATLVAAAAINQPGAVARVAGELALIERVCGVRPSLLISGIAGAYYVDDGAGGAATGDLAALAGAFGGAASRSSAAWHHGPGGVLTQAAAGVPRRAYSPEGVPLGILQEGASATNKIQNSSGGGAAAGAPGTIPARWTRSLTSGVGIDTSIVGTGTEDGFPVTYFRIYGTATGAGNLTLGFENTNIIAAAAGQYWSLSCYFSTAAGSFSGLAGGAMRIRGRDSVGTQIEYFDAAIDGNVSKIRKGVTKKPVLLTNAAIAYVQPSAIFSWSAGAIVDVTIGVAVPTLTNTPNISSPIITTAGDVTRAVDGLSLIPPLAANPGGVGTLFTDVMLLDLLYGGNTDVSNCRYAKSGYANSLNLRTRYYTDGGAKTDLYVANNIYDGTNTNVLPNSRVRQAVSWSASGYIYTCIPQVACRLR